MKYFFRKCLSTFKIVSVFIRTLLISYASHETRTWSESLHTTRLCEEFKFSCFSRHLLSRVYQKEAFISRKLPCNFVMLCLLVAGCLNKVALSVNGNNSSSNIRLTISCFSRISFFVPSWSQRILLLVRKKRLNLFIKSKHNHFRRKMY